MTTDLAPRRCDNCRHYVPEPAPKLAGRCYWLLRQSQPLLPRWTRYPTPKPIVPGYARDCDTWEPRP